MRVTLRDIAEEVGLSVSSVSRVINNTGRISDEKRKAVFEAAKRLNYTPNANARELKKQTSSTIGVIIPDITNTFFVRMLKSIDHRLWEQGYNIIFCDTDENVERELEYYQLLKEKNVAGIIVSPASRSMIYENETQNINCVFVDNEPYITEKPYSFVSINNCEASMELTQYVIDRGYRDIVMITGDLDETSSNQRLIGFQNCLRANNIEWTHDRVYFGDCHYKSGYEITEELIIRNKLPECIYAHNNVEAFGAYAALRKYGIQIPEDIALVCFDGEDSMSMRDKNITGIVQPVEEIAEVAIEMVLNNMKTPGKHSRKLLPYKFSEGQTLKSKK
jgi:Transcriptional regulators